MQKGCVLSQNSQKNVGAPALGMFKSNILSLFFSYQKENAVGKDYAVFMNTLNLKRKNSPFCDNVNSPMKH